MHKWYVIQVMSSQEKRVKKSLEDGREQAKMTGVIESVLVPTENVSDVKGGQQRIVERRIWPGYVLVKMELTDDSFMYVKGTTGVIDFLGGGTPTALSDVEVEKILADLESKKETITHKHKFQIGDSVKITDGVFVNFVGTVTDVFPDKGRLSVMVSIFGRDTRVDDLEFWQVEEVTEKAES